MGILSDRQIRRFDNPPIIVPFEEGVERPGVISYGLSSYGYDVRLDRKFKVFTNVWGSLIDPKNFDPRAFVEHEGDFCIIPPNSFILGMTVETITVPRDILIVCIGKSTIARCGLIVNVTPLEPEWHGRVTLEISNTTPLPAKVYANEGIAQLLFFRSDEADRPVFDLSGERKPWCETSYKDKKGKYQNQTEIVLPKID